MFYFYKVKRQSRTVLSSVLKPLTSINAMGSESHLIATILEKYYKVCEREEIFISQNRAEDKSAAALYDKPGTSSCI